MIRETPPGVAVICDAARGRHPASDGAHRLGWWIAEQADCAVAAAMVAGVCGVSCNWLERVVLGEIEPGDIERHRIAMATEGMVAPGDWMQGGPLRWREQPGERVFAAYRSDAA